MWTLTLAAHIAAREAERQRAERQAEAARQLPLWREPDWPEPDVEDVKQADLPTWATDY